MSTRFTLTIILFATLQFSFSQDVAVLRSGQRLEGKILQREKGQITFLIAGTEEPRVLRKAVLMRYSYDHRQHFAGSHSLDISLAPAFFTPGASLKKLLDTKGFGSTVEHDFLGLRLGSSSYPIRRDLPIIGFTANYAISPRAEIGASLSYLGGMAKGFSHNSGYLTLNYHLIQLMPAYRHYSAYHHSYLEAGLPLNLLQVNGAKSELQTGLKVAYGIVLSQSKLSGMQLRFAYGHGFAPFHLESKFRVESGNVSRVMNKASFGYHMFEIGLVYSSRHWKQLENESGN